MTRNVHDAIVVLSLKWLEPCHATEKLSYSRGCQISIFFISLSRWTEDEKALSITLAFLFLSSMKHKLPMKLAIVKFLFQTVFVLSEHSAFKSLAWQHNPVLFIPPTTSLIPTVCVLPPILIVYLVQTKHTIQSTLNNMFSL